MNKLFPFYLAIFFCTSVHASDTPVQEMKRWAVHGQTTYITQKHSDFTSPYSGTNSLSANGPMVESADITLFAGVRLWHDAEFWINPEIDQGFGFNNTLGVAGFPNGDVVKVGSNAPYLRFPRFFIRHIFSLDGEKETITAGPNQLAGIRSSNNVTLTIGKLSVIDIFDTNRYAHDPRADFLNWSIVDAGTYDYAGDTWGYTYGAAVEWNQDWWTLRGGFFQLSSKPGGKIARVNFGGNSTNIEFEVRHQWLGRPGKIRLLTWVNQGKMGSYQDAVALGRQTDTTPEMALVRKDSSRPGVALNIEQELSSDVGAFARFSANRGDKEAYGFTDINQSLSGGLVISGTAWGRHDDTLGIAGAINRISGDAQTYLAAGGLGLQIGDGKLNYAPEKILELYYSVQLTSFAAATLNYQFIDNPAYNQDRGPVSVYGLRLHAGF